MITGKLCSDDTFSDLHVVNTGNCEETKQVKMNSSVEEDKINDIRKISTDYGDVLTDIPGETDLLEHGIHLTSTVSLRTKQYPLPLSMMDLIRSEKDNMFKLGIIEPSNSPYSSPVVLVNKSDNTVRFCIDFRNMNKITVFDSEPIPNPEEIFAKLSQSVYFTKLDLRKGYWQIKLSETSTM